jgi:predicted transposase/invertase (TIGR01784 family)
MSCSQEELLQLVSDKTQLEEEKMSTLGDRIWEEGKVEGREEGSVAAREEIARTMLDAGMSAEQIRRFAGIDSSKIQASH